MNDDETMEDTKEATEMQCDMQEVSHQIAKSLSCKDVASREVSDVKVQGLAGNSGLQACSSISEVCCTNLFWVNFVSFVLFQFNNQCLEVVGSEALWTYQCLHGCGKRYSLFIWRNDGSQR